MMGNESGDYSWQTTVRTGWELGIIMHSWGKALLSQLGNLQDESGDINWGLLANGLVSWAERVHWFARQEEVIVKLCRIWQDENGVWEVISWIVNEASQDSIFGALVPMVDWTIAPRDVQYPNLWNLWLLPYVANMWLS